MCKIRAYRYKCGHYSTRTLSQCRGTFATPKKTAKPLCLADPTLTVKLDEQCSECQYDAFCSDWETRIAAALDRQFAAHQTCVSNRSAATGLEYSWGDEPDFDNPMLSGQDFGDSQEALRERERAAEEVARLQTEYYREQWSRFPSLMEQRTQRGYQSEPRRRSKPRKNGMSPLKRTISPEDFGPDEFVDVSRERVGSDGPSETSSDEGTLSERSSSLDELWQDFNICTGWGNSLDCDQPPQPEPEAMLPDWGAW